MLGLSAMFVELLSKLVHPLVDGFARLVKQTFQVREMVGLAVMVRDGARWVVRRRVTDVRQAALDQREHVLRSLLVK